MLLLRGWNLHAITPQDWLSLSTRKQAPDSGFQILVVLSNEEDAIISLFVVHSKSKETLVQWVKKVKSAYELIGPSGQRLSSISVEWTDWWYLYSPWMGWYSIAGLPPAFIVPVTNYTSRPSCWKAG